MLTSSFAAVGYSPKPGAEYTEADWTDPDTPGLPPYPRSKTIAERTAGYDQLGVAALMFDEVPMSVPGLSGSGAADPAFVKPRCRLVPWLR